MTITSGSHSLLIKDIIPTGIFHSKNKNRFHRPMLLKFKNTEEKKSTNQLRGRRENKRHNLVGAYTSDQNQTKKTKTIQKKKSISEAALPRPKQNQSESSKLPPRSGVLVLLPLTFNRMWGVSAAGVPALDPLPVDVPSSIERPSLPTMDS